MELKKSSYIHLAVMLIIAFGISVLPPFGMVTPFGMKAIGAFVAVLYGWIFFDLFWTSLFGFLILPILGLNSLAGAFATGIGHQMICIVLLTIVFAVALNSAGVPELVIQWLFKRKIINKSPWALIIGILLIAALLGAVGLGMAAMFLLWSIVYKICDYSGIEKRSSMMSFMIFEIAFLANTMSFILPFSAGVLIYQSFMLQVAGAAPIPAGPYMANAAITLIALAVLNIVVAVFVFKVDASKFALSDEIKNEITSAEVTSKQKNSFMVLVAYIAILLYATLLPSAPGAAFVNMLGVGGISLIGALVLAMLNESGKGYVRLQDVFRNVDWSLLFLLAVTYPIADAIKHADAGIMPTIMTAVTPIVSQFGPFAFVVVCTLILGTITQVTHNIVLGAMFMPFLMPILDSVGGNMYTLWFILLIVLNLAYVTPAGSMQSAMVFGNENMGRKYAYGLGAVLLVTGFVVYLGLGIFTGNFFFAGLI